MTLRSRSEATARAVVAALGAAPSAEQAERVRALIEQSVIDALLEANRRSVDVARACCGADRDMAHKLAEEIEGAHRALIANLSSMR